MVLNKKHNTKQLIYGFLGIALMSVAILSLIYNPAEFLILYLSEFRNGSLAFIIWKSAPYEILTAGYIFNVTNHEAFVAGIDEKLNFEQVGPFVYQEFTRFSNLSFNSNGTFTYEISRTTLLRPELSIGDPKDFVIIAPNLALLGIASAMEDMSMWANLGLNQLTSYLDAQPMLNLTVQEFLWGYDDPLIGLANNLIPSWISFEKLGILDRMYDDGRNIVTINLDPTVKPSQNPLLTDEEKTRPYGIQLWNGSPGLEQWGYDPSINNTKNTRCNMIEGVYDGVMFPPKLPRNATFQVFRKSFCRSLPFEFSHQGRTPNGFHGYYYKLQENAFESAETNPENECYCKQKGKCLPTGFSDITPCYYGIPTAVSQPHFYNVDPETQAIQKIGGLKPNKSEHDLLFVIQPESGVPVWGRYRVQTNLVVKDTKFNSRTRPYNNMILPIFWTELIVEEIPWYICLVLTLNEIYPFLQIGAIIITFSIGFTLVMYLLISFFWIPNIQTRHSIDYAPVKIIPGEMDHPLSGDPPQYGFVVDRETKC